MDMNLFLRPGDTLGVCAPSGKFDTGLLEQGVHVLNALGFQVRLPEAIFNEKRYLAGDDRTRAGVIRALFADPDIHGIICARGGYGALRILDYLDWEIIGQNPKPFIGYSDITALLMAILSRTGVPVIHGPNLVSLASADQETLDAFVQVLTGPLAAIEISCGSVLSPGIAHGVIKGGNLATLSHLLGTPYQPDFTDAVLFIEDVGEPAYKIDRMLTQMKMAGMFDRIQGVVTGLFENCEDQSHVQEILTEIFVEYAIPVICGMPAGHGKTNRPFVMGKQVHMDTRTMTLEWV